MRMSSTSNSSPESPETDTEGVADSDSGTLVAGTRGRLATPPINVKDIFLHPVIAGAITLGLLALVTWWISWLRFISGAAHPYTILYLIPVAVGAAFLGIRGGIAATVLVLILARVYLFNDHKGGLSALLSFPDLAEGLEFMTLTMGTLAIASVTGRLRSTLVQLRRSNDRLEQANTHLAEANQQLIESERLRRDFNRDVLLAVTGGKLQLVERDDLPGPQLLEKPPVIMHALVDAIDATKFRQALQTLVFGAFMDVERTADLLTSCTEAATNAIKHGRGGEATVWMTDDNVYVLVVDNGDGIAPTHLARATLEKGYSTRISLGMGFHMILESCDSLALSTGENGTALLIRVSNCPRGSESDQILAKYLKL
jgi:anti-sigma regulatory factor (Ser/Thr protein kinase)